MCAVDKFLERFLPVYEMADQLEDAYKELRVVLGKNPEDYDFNVTLRALMIERKFWNNELDLLEIEWSEQFGEDHGCVYDWF